MRLNNLLMGGVLASAIALAGCGTTPGDRAVSGGMIGAGAGAIIGAATGTPATGAAIGAAAGALVGAATDPCDLDLGKPFPGLADQRRDVLALKGDGRALRVVLVVGVRLLRRLDHRSELTL